MTDEPIYKHHKRPLWNTESEKDFINHLGTYYKKFLRRDIDQGQRRIRLLNNYWNSLFKRVVWDNINRKEILSHVENIIWGKLMENSESKALRYRFWQLGRQRRIKIVREMGFNTPGFKERFCEKDEQGNFKENIEMELVQRKIFFFIYECGRKEELLTLIEREGAEKEKEESGRETIRVTGSVLTEQKRSTEELQAIKYVPGKKI